MWALIAGIAEFFEANIVVGYADGPLERLILVVGSCGDGMTQSFDPALSSAAFFGNPATFTSSSPFLLRRESLSLLWRYLRRRH